MQVIYNLALYSDMFFKSQFAAMKTGRTRVRPTPCISSVHETKQAAFYLPSNTEFPSLKRHLQKTLLKKGSKKSFLSCIS